MNKKLVAVLVLALVVSTASVFALGIGAQGGYTVNGRSSGALTIKPDGSKTIYAINGNAYYGGFWADVTADRWTANKTLAKPINYFYGLGGAIGAEVWTNHLGVTVAGRAVLGANTFFLDGLLEAYLQGAWQPGVTFNLGGGNFFNPHILSFPINIGIRFWL